MNISTELLVWRPIYHRAQVSRFQIDSVLVCIGQSAPRHSSMLKRSGEFNRSSFGQSIGEGDSVGLIHMTPEWYSLVVCSRV